MSVLDAALFVTAGLLLSAVLAVGAHGAKRPVVWRAISALIAVATLTVAAARYGLAQAAAVGALVLVITALLVGTRRDLTVSGRAVLVAQLWFLIAFVAWGAHYVLTLDVSTTTRLLMLSAAPIALVAVPLAVVRTYEDWEVLCRARWRRPHQAIPITAETWRQPFVSIHVPVHAEPPAVVIDTLSRLARLAYRHFEVIVLDNNTADRSLWEPVAAYCTALGDRFRFHHVEGLAGAKAGALNLALEYTDPRAELIAIVDADYQAEPNFLSDCAPFFEDPAMGFVQTPHAYRGWQSSRFQRMCNWEYGYFYNNTMVSLNERNAAITVGTMCLIRKEALERAGRWAEWCLTEDSELAVRIHALGYSSVYLDQVYGRGLIPATFEGYRRQRFRWTYGPVQEFHRHWRLLLGRRPSRLTFAQRVHHTTHGLYGVALLAAAISLPVMAGVVASMALHHERVGLPFELWAAATAGLLTNYLHRYLVYRRMGATPAETIGALTASAALSIVIITANAAAYLRRPASWQRTDKFERDHHGWRALRATRVEILTAATLVAAGLTAYVLGAGAGVSGMLVIGLLLQAALILTSPALALLAERDLRRAAAYTPRHGNRPMPRPRPSPHPRADAARQPVA